MSDDPDRELRERTGRVHSIMDTRASTRANDEIAEMLGRVADLLEAQHASVYRVRAYRAGARTVRSLQEPLSELIESGDPKSLEALPGIGKSLAAVIREFVAGGRPGLLERLEGQTSPAELFATIPGIGEELAGRIEHQLHLGTLEDLEVAAHDGRLLSVPGFGERRVRAVQETLGHLLRHSAARRARSRDRAVETPRPPVKILLEVDQLYRDASRRGTLQKIAPRRFNPEHRAWLPILHHEIAGWSTTAMFSNTARAHQLGRTDDWVVVYYERDGIDGQCTVVTEHSGPLKGERVVRGREAECREYYAGVP